MCALSLGEPASKPTPPSPRGLSQFLLFKDLNGERLAKVKSFLHCATFPKGTKILSVGESGETVYFLVSGLVRISVPDEDGNEVVLGIRGPGEVLGEINLVDGGGHSANVIVEEEASFLWMDRHALQRCLREFPPIAYNLNLILARRVRVVTEQIRFHSTQDVWGRVCRQIHALVRDYGVPCPEGGILIPVRLTQNTLAKLVSASRPSVNQVLMSLRRSKCISIDSDHRIVVRDLAALENRFR